MSTDGVFSSIEAKLKAPLSEATCVGKSKAKQMEREAFLNSLKRKRDAVESEEMSMITDGISSSNEAKSKAPIPESTCAGKWKAKQKTVGHQTTATHIKSGVNSAVATKPDPKSRNVQSSIPDLAKNYPKKGRDFLGLSLTSGYMALLPELRSLDVSSGSSSSSSESDDDAQTDGKKKIMERY